MFQYDPKLIEIIGSADQRIKSELRRAAPFMAEKTEAWMRHCYGEGALSAYFSHPEAYPMFLLPWLLEETIVPDHDLEFQSDVAYSTLNGFHYIRLIDNVMDGDVTSEVELLPILGYFHSNFQSPYHRYFEFGHPFWNTFASVWLETAEVTYRDGSFQEVGRDEFIGVSARKTGATKIPIAAVCHRYSRLGLLTLWSQFVDVFGCWNQMQNDLFDWHRDLTSNVTTYFLAEGKRQKRADDTEAEWVMREGFDWGINELAAWSSEMRALGRELQTKLLIAYLENREAIIAERSVAVAEGFAEWAKLVAVLGRLH